MKKIILILATIFLPFMVFGQSLITTYEYDELNRLVQVDYPNGQRVEYEYDALGNRISRTVSQLLAVQVNINPQGAGTVSGVGNYEPGTLVSLEASANEGHTFANWMHDGEVVSTALEYSFTITQHESFVANFTVNSYDITATADPTEGGSVNGAGAYEYGTSCTLTALVNDGYVFVNWTKDGEEVSTEQTYTFIVREDAALVAHFESIWATHESSLANGWNWWTPTVETSIESIQTALGNNYVQILSENGQTGGDVVAGKMYKIKTSSACTLELTGMPITTATVTITQGTNWIGYIGTEKTVSDALYGFNAAIGDKLISQDGGFAIYTSNGWQGTLTALQPGSGYVYFSASSEQKTLMIGE